MSKKYEPPKPTGREFVESTRAFKNYAKHIATKLPDSWSIIYVEPMIRAVQDINDLVVEGNKVYIREDVQSAQDVLNAYSLRIQYLQKALRKFPVYESALNDITGHINLLKGEKERIKRILLKIISEQQEKGNLPQNLKIEVANHDADIYFETMGNVKKTKLGITIRNFNRLCELEKKSMDLIKQRIAMDKAAMKKIEAAIA